MKVLFINGSPNPHGATSRAIEEMIKVFDKEGIESKVIQVGDKAIHGCLGCGKCFDGSGCIFDDGVNEAVEEFKSADGLVVASPVYYASANGTLLSFLDRLFYSSRCEKRMKVGASLSCARRAGTTATFDQLNKYFAISGMPIASGQYWNGFFGSYKEDEDDLEGLQQMETLATNMVFLMKSIALGKSEFGLPERKKKARTNFIR